MKKVFEVLVFILLVPFFTVSFVYVGIVGLVLFVRMILKEIFKKGVRK